MTIDVTLSPAEMMQAALVGIWEHTFTLDLLSYEGVCRGALVWNQQHGKTMVWSAQQAHRNYAKRQMTWFRRESGVQWIKGFGDQAITQSDAIAHIDREV